MTQFLCQYNTSFFTVWMGGHGPLKTILAKYECTTNVYKIDYTLQKIFVIFTNSLVDLIKIKFSIQLNES